MSWKPQPETLVSFESGADKRYLARVAALRQALTDDKDALHSDTSDYSVWPHLTGRCKNGEFPLVVAAEHYRRQGYTVWFCEPVLEQYGQPNFVCFMLLSYPGRRRAGHPAYKRMQNVFGKATVERLNIAADLAKQQMGGGRGNKKGGDPDLFVFNDCERFFVEVKWRDRITPKQQVTFPLIEQHCKVEVKIARIVERGLHEKK